MRKVFVAALGLASLGNCLYVQSALAEKSCDTKQIYSDCISKVSNPSSNYRNYCIAQVHKCSLSKPENQVHNGPFQPGRDAPPKGKDGDSKGGASKPKPGAPRTADGGTIMVTPEGQEWVWNGKYSPPVVTINREGYQVVITVKQGDPDVFQMRYVNGQLYNIADPKYAEAIAAEQAKASGSKGGSKGGTKTGYHPLAAPVAGGVTTFVAPGQSAPVAGSGAVADGSAANAAGNANKAPTPPRQNAINSVLHPAGSSGIGKSKPQVN